MLECFNIYNLKMYEVLKFKFVVDDEGYFNIFFECFI